MLLVGNYRFNPFAVVAAMDGFLATRAVDAVIPFFV
jgi:hypothetical protein